MKMLLAAALVAGVLPIGVGPSKSAAAGTAELSRSPHAATADMTYHGGWVMRTNTTYAIYWFPSGSTCGAASCDSYVSGVDRFFKDVAAASGSDSNVYSVDTQYSDTTGPIAYQSAFGGAFVADAPFPAYNPSTSCTQAPNAVCLTDQQVRTEIQNVITALGWPNGESSLFVLMVPSSVGECLDAASGQCVGCGNHGRFTGSNSQPVLYAFIPYSATFGCAGNPKNPSPNGDDADPAVNVISHEMNEAITNPWGDAWYAGDTQHGEIGDLCAWNFGNPLGTAPNGQAYNQVINGHYYYLQQEWSNDGSRCLQRYVPGVDLPASLTAPTVTGAAGVGQILSTSDGTWSGTPTSYSYRWQRCKSGDLSSCTDIAAATAATYRLVSSDAGSVVRSEVTALNAAGASAPVASAVSDVVVPVPAATTAPALSGPAAVGRTLSTSPGAWNTAVSSFAYQWLSCAADGSSCAPIPGATKTSYLLGAADAGHTLEARVSATNAAGTTVALSNRSAVVVALPAATTAPRISGRARVGKKLSARRGSWTNSPTAYRYQWLRCNKRGGSCKSITRATHSTYRLGKRDVGHRLRLRVVARNLAGSASATSRSTARVR
jgi:Phosphate-induced protein 1 conserved region